MILIVTGTPGTGKTEVSRELARILRIPLLEIKDIVLENRIFTGNMEGEKIVDLAKLRKLVSARLKAEDDIIMDSHLLCEMRLPADIVVVLRTEPKELRTRLARRGYPKKKIDENVLCEMLDYCLLKAEANYPQSRILQADTTRRDAVQNARRIALAIRHKKKSLDNVNYSNRLLKSLVS